MGLDFLLELGCEEIPARYVELILHQLSERFNQFLGDYNLPHDGIETFATPRRLVFHISSLEPFQSDRTELAIGPPISVAFDNQNRPTNAAEGFARKLGVLPSALQRISTERGDYLSYERRILGRSAREVLLEGLPKVVKALELPKNMKWESSQFLFIRPIRWLLGLLGGEVLPFRLADVVASNETFGHRVLSNNQTIQVNDYESYKSGLLKFNICFDQRERLQRIRTQLEQSANACQGKLVSDPELLQTVIYLNEFPTILQGSFDSSYLRMPREVLVTVMREHQKYFSLLDKNDHLKASFLAVVDSDETHHDLIRAGHERVLRARLADASFLLGSGSEKIVEQPS